METAYLATPNLPGWQAAILKGIGAPVTSQNLLFLNSWARAEGGGASSNPFNTTQQAPGAGSYNSVGVRNYLNPQQGIQATVQTLRNGRYGNILAALKAGTDAHAAASALANSPWGTGSLVLKMLGAPSQAPVSTSSAPSPGNPTQASPGPRIDPQTLNLFNQGNRLFGLAPLPESLGVAPPRSAPPRLPTQGPLPSPSGAASAIPAVKGRNAVNLASHLLGIPYSWGGESLKGFDCSGLLQYVWQRQGVNIPRTTYDQWKQGQSVGANQLQAGDAVFFKGSDSRTAGGQVLPGHVGIYIGGGKFIEAPHTGSQVRISSLQGRTDFMGARRYA